MRRERGTVKSCTELERLFKVEIMPVNQGYTGILKSKITKAADPEIELFLSFVNKERDPLKLPVLKRYTMKADETGKKFLS